jgi:hypothetical protein
LPLSDRNLIFRQQDAKNTTSFGENGVEVKKLRPSLIFNVQLRLDKERCELRHFYRSARRFKIRRWRGNTTALPLGNKAVDLGKGEGAGAGYGVDRRQQEEQSRLRGSDGLWKT